MLSSQKELNGQRKDHRSRGYANQMADGSNLHTAD